MCVRSLHSLDKGLCFRLQSVGIPPLVDLPVGENLMDHVAAGGVMFTLGGRKGLTVNIQTILDNPDVMGEYARHRRGPMTIPGGVEAVGFLRVRDNSTR